MTDFHIEVVQLGKVGKHPNADNLSITQVRGFPCIFRTGDFQPGDHAVYVPVDAVTPKTEEWAFLSGHHRIRARKIRGIFSMGVLMPVTDSTWRLGQDVAEAMSITRYEEPEPKGNQGRSIGGPAGGLPHYDIENLRRNQDLFIVGEEVWITEKIHGCNGRWVFKDGKLHCGSRNEFRTDGSLWNRIADQYGLGEKLSDHPGLALYGEVYGPGVQDLGYGVPMGEARLALFDAYDTNTGRWLDVDTFLGTVFSLQLPVVPMLYRGPWKPELLSLAEGISVHNMNVHEEQHPGCAGKFHVREGIVVKPVMEKWHPDVGRLFLKLAGEGYHLRKSAA